MGIVDIVRCFDGDLGIFGDGAPRGQFEMLSKMGRRHVRKSPKPDSNFANLLGIFLFCARDNCFDQIVNDVFFVHISCQISCATSWTAAWIGGERQSFI